jgi:hypothetical protein
MGECADIQTTPANHERTLSAELKLGDAPLRCCGILRDIEGMRQRHIADEMMRHARKHRRRWFCREDIQTLVDLKCICAHDLGSAAIRNFDGDRGFPDSRWPQKEDGRAMT